MDINNIDDIVIYLDLSSLYDVVPMTYNGEDGVFVPRRFNYTEAVHNRHRRILTFRCRQKKDSDKAYGMIEGILAIPLSDIDLFAKSDRTYLSPLMGKKYIPRAIRKDLKNILDSTLDADE